MLGDRRTYTQRQFRELLIQHFGISERYAHKVIVRGNGYFWDTTEHDDNFPGSVRIRTPYDLSMQFKVKLGSPETRAVEEILDSSTLKSIYLRLLDFYNANASSPLTKKTMEELTGISVRLQYIYDRELGERKRKTYNIEEVCTDGAEACRAYQEGVKSGKYQKHKHKPVANLHIKSETGSINVSGAVVKRTGSEYVSHPVGKADLNGSRMCLGRSTGDGCQVWAGRELLPVILDGSRLRM